MPSEPSPCHKAPMCDHGVKSSTSCLDLGATRDPTHRTSGGLPAGRGRREGGYPAATASGASGDAWATAPDDVALSVAMDDVARARMRQKTADWTSGAPQLSRSATDGTVTVF